MSHPELATGLVPGRGWVYARGVSREEKPQDVSSVTLRSCGAGLLSVSLAGGLLVAGWVSWHALLSPHEPVAAMMFAPLVALCGASVVLLLCLEAVPKVALVLALAHLVSKKTGRATLGYASLYVSGLVMLMASVALGRFSVWPAVAEHADMQAVPAIAVGVVFATLLGASFAFGETRAALSRIEREARSEDQTTYPSVRFDRGAP